jgi:hypothetical protein
VPIGDLSRCSKDAYSITSSARARTDRDRGAINSELVELADQVGGGEGAVNEAAN